MRAEAPPNIQFCYPSGFLSRCSVCFHTAQHTFSANSNGWRWLVGKLYSAARRFISYALHVCLLLHKHFRFDWDSQTLPNFPPLIILNLLVGFIQDGNILSSSCHTLNIVCRLCCSDTLRQSINTNALRSYPGTNY